MFFQREMPSELLMRVKPCSCACNAVRSNACRSTWCSGCPSRVRAPCPWRARTSSACRSPASMKGTPVLLGEADVLLLAQFVFPLRMDVGVVEEDGVVDAGGLYGFHDFAGAGRAAGMQQQPVACVSKPGGSGSGARVGSFMARSFSFFGQIMPPCRHVIGGALNRTTTGRIAAWACGVMAVLATAATTGQYA